MEKNLNAYLSGEIVSHYEDQTSLQKPEESILRLLKDSLGNMSMLDIGTGGGRTTLHFAPLTKEYTGIDYSVRMVEASQRKFPGIRFLTADVRDLGSFPEKTFDFILFSFNGIDYIPYKDRLTALQQIARVLKKGGYFFFSSHNLYAIEKWKRIPFSLNPLLFIHHIRTYFKRKALNRLSAGKIKEILQREFTVVNDGAHNWELETCYIRPESQIQQLKQIGFNQVIPFDLRNGKVLTEEDLKGNRDNWIYYLCN